MIEVTTYIVSKGELLNLDEVSGMIDEGVVRLVVNGRDIIDLSWVDSIVEFWAYFVNSLEALSEHGHSSLYFPSQPIDIQFKIEQERVYVECFGNKGSEKSLIFLRTVISECEKFFVTLSESNGSKKDICDFYLDKLSKLRKQELHGHP